MMVSQRSKLAFFAGVVLLGLCLSLRQAVQRACSQEPAPFTCRPRCVRPPCDQGLVRSQAAARSLKKQFCFFFVLV